MWQMSDDLSFFNDCAAVFVIFRVARSLVYLAWDQLERRRLPLFVAARCDVSDGPPPTVVMEGRLTHYVGQFFPKRAESVNAMLTASWDGFELSTAGNAAPTVGIRRSEMGSSLIGFNDVRGVFVYSLVLAAALGYCSWSGLLPAGRVAALLIAYAVAGAIVFDGQSTFIFTVHGPEERAIALRLVATGKRASLERAMEALKTCMLGRQHMERLTMS